MRRLSGLVVVLSAGLVGACGGSSPNGGLGGAGGAAGTKGSAGAGGAAGVKGSAGAAGQSAGGAAGQSVGGAAGQSAGGAAGQSAGGAAGQSAAGAAGQSVGGAAGQSAGGAAGQSAGGAAGNAAGGAGGSGVACLDPSTFSSYFTIADSTFCAVAMYTAPEAVGYQAPTWGSHGGPLVVQQVATGAAGSSGASVTLERWTAPTGSTGTMTVQTTSVASAVPAGTFLGNQAVDLPFFGWTAISYVNPFPDTSGKFEMIASGAIATSYDVNGPFSVAAVPAASSLGRLLYSGLSPIGTATAGTNGLYQADACSSPAQDLGTGTGCSASGAVATWGDSSGPVAIDSQGDVFAVLSSFAGTQEARGFLASTIARGAAATDGVSLFTLPGYSGSLAALSPTATAPGVVVFQPNDGSTYAPLDVIQQKFTTGSALAAMGATSSLLTVPSTATQDLSFLVDGSERLWVAANGDTSTTYVVLARQ